MLIMLRRAFISTLGAIGVVILLLYPIIVHSQQLRWSQMDGNDPPPARRSHAMAYDPDNKLVVQFGGFGNNSHLNDTWILDPQTGSWNNVSPSLSPSDRAATTLVYEPGTKQSILFGGFAVGHSLVHNDTWAYNASSNMWKDLKPSSAPSARASYGMAYDSRQGVLVLFGGFTEQGYFNDLWLYDPARNSWEERQVDGDVPAPRGAMGFAYDEANNVFVMFGGFSDAGFFADTWILDLENGTWTEKKLETHPPPIRTRMVYANSIAESVFFGGDLISEENGALYVEPYDKVWAYDYSSNRWQDLTPAGSSAASPAKRTLNGIAYDSNSESLLIFGGTDALIDSENFVGREFQDTWSLSLQQGPTSEQTSSDGRLSPLEFTVPIFIGISAAGIATVLFMWRRKSRASALK
jgi:N-acetylneuraminic acid mutarotase